MLSREPWKVVFFYHFACTKYIFALVSSCRKLPFLVSPLGENEPRKVDRKMHLLILLSLLCLGAAEQITYTIGGSSVIFVYTRRENVTTVTWPDFGAVADSAGAINSGMTEIPAAYVPGPTYIYPPEALVRCAGLSSGVAFMQLSSGPPMVNLSPINGEDSSWTSGESVVFRASSATYSNS